MNTFPSLVVASALAFNAGTTAAKDTPPEIDPRVCMQSLGGQVIRTSCENIAGILSVVPGWKADATKDFPDGSQLNKISDKDGNPVLVIYTPPKKFTKKK